MPCAVKAAADHLLTRDVKVSILIPVLNEAAHVADAVQRAWESGADEVIVADGGSTDATLEIACGLRCELVETNSGRAMQQNAAARKARGDVLLFLHADTFLEADAISQITAALARDKAAWGGAFRQRIEAPGVAYRLLERANALRVRRLRLPYGDQGLFVRREVFFTAGEFPKVKLLEDLLLAKTLRRRGPPLLLPGPLHVSARRWQKHGLVRQTLRNWSILLAHACGASPDSLATWYRRHDA